VFGDNVQAPWVENEVKGKLLPVILVNVTTAAACVAVTLGFGVVTYE